MDKDKVVEIFGFHVKIERRNVFASSIFKAYKARYNKHLGEDTEISKLPLQHHLIMEIQHREDKEVMQFFYRKVEEEKKKVENELRERRPVLKYLCENIKELASVLAFKKDKKYYYRFFEYNKPTSIKKLFEREKEETPSKERVMDAVNILDEFLSIYMKLRNYGVLHKLIRPEYLFKDKDNKLKVILFSFACRDVKIMKVWQEKDNDYEKQVLNRIDTTMLANIYTYRLEVWDIGMLFYFMLYGKELFKHESMRFKKREMKKLVSSKLPGIDQNIQRILQECFEEDNKRIDLVCLWDLVKRVKQAMDKGINTSIEPDPSKFDSVFRNSLKEIQESEKSLKESRLKTDAQGIEKEFQDIKYYINRSVSLLSAYKGKVMMSRAVPKAVTLRVSFYVIKILKMNIQNCKRKYSDKFKEMNYKDDSILNSFIQFLNDTVSNLDKYEEDIELDCTMDNYVFGFKKYKTKEEFYYEIENKLADLYNSYENRTYSYQQSNNDVIDWTCRILYLQSFELFEYHSEDEETG